MNNQMSFDKDKLALIKGLMALLIVADHLGLFYEIIPLKSFTILGPIIVSVFFFISGYGLQYSYCRRGEEYLNHFFTRRIWKVLVPFFLASVLYFLVLLFPENENGDILKCTYIGGIPSLPFSWFVWVLLFLYISFYVTYRLFPGYWKIVGLCLLVGVYVLGTIFALFASGWWISTLGFPAGMFFSLFEKRIYGFFQKNIFNYWFALLALLIIITATYLFGNDYVRIISFACIPLTVAIIVVRLPLQRLNVLPVTFLAMISYEIYLCQGISMTLLRGRFYIQNDLLFVISVYALTIILAWGLHFVFGLMTGRSCKPCARCM